MREYKRKTNEDQNLSTACLAEKERSKNYLLLKKKIFIKMADSFSDENLNDALEGTSILKTVKIISRWMQALEEKRSHSEDDVETGEGESSASSELKSSEIEMIDFFKSFKKELYRKQQNQRVEIIVDECPERLSEKKNRTDENDEMLLKSHGRARANSTFQTVKYIGRWMRAVDRKTNQPETNLFIPEENEEEIYLEEDEDEEEKGEEEMIRFFRSLKLDDEEVVEEQQVDAETTLDKSDHCKVDKMRNDGGDDEANKMQKEGSDRQKEIERKAIVMNTVKFVIRWMEKAETNKMKH